MMAAAALDHAEDGRSEGEASRPTESALPSAVDIDLGNLAAFDPRPLEAEDFRTEESADAACLRVGRDVLQALATAIFTLPSRPDKVGRLVDLPPPTTPLPRAKPLPKPRPPTKWEKFAQSKGIVKKKRSRLVLDEATGEYKRRHGYQRANNEADQIIVEARASDEVGTDPFEKMAASKRERVAKQEKNRLQNLKQAVKARGSAVLPSTIALAATNLATSGGPKQDRRKVDKGDLQEAVGQAGVATASIGKFDTKRPGEKPIKNKGKKRKFLPVEDTANERKQTMSVLGKVMAKYNDDIFDTDRAVGVYNVAQEKQRAEKNRKQGGQSKKRKYNKADSG